MERITVVIPCYQEEQVLATLFGQLTAHARQWDVDWEVLCVDDGSTDRTWSLITEQHQSDPRWQGIRLSRNFGHQIAISAGLYHATGDAVIVMDADLQDPPEDLVRFIAKWRQGYDVVYAVRSVRQDPLFKRVCYWLFYRMMAYMSEIPIPLDSGDLCLMDRKVVDIIRSLPEHNRFVRGLRAWCGFRQVAVRHERHARAAGRPKYTLRKLVTLALNGFFGFSARSLRIATVTGALLMVVSMLGCAVVAGRVMFPQQFARMGITFSPELVFLSMCVLALGSVQLLCLGIVGEYLARIYDEVKHRPLWLISETTINVPDKAAPRSPRRSFDTLAEPVVVRTENRTSSTEIQT